MKKITILVAEDHTLLRESFCLMLQSDPRFDVVDFSRDDKETIQALTQEKPDIVLLDINLPGSNGSELVMRIQSASPSTKIVCVTPHAQPNSTRSLLKIGVMGYITWNSGAGELYHAIEEASENRKYICEEVKDNLAGQTFTGTTDIEPIAHLSPRELDIVEFLRKGWSSREIAGTTCLSQKTVEGHRYNILKKLRLKNVAALVNYVNEHQLLAERDHSLS